MRRFLALSIERYYTDLYTYCTCGYRLNGKMLFESYDIQIGSIESRSYCTLSIQKEMLPISLFYRLIAENVRGFVIVLGQCSIHSATNPRPFLT
jgi:hypothetical protein